MTYWILFGLFTFLGIYCWFKGKDRLALYSIALGCGSVSLFYALNYPFLHQWDEQFHALVAKHMMEDPLHPKLYKDPAFDFAPNAWNLTDTWLHKQPFFMWVLALSMKIFGVGIPGLRLPSVLLHIGMVFVVWEMGKTLFNRRLAFWGALAYGCSLYAIALSGGYFTNDHNDTFMTFLVSLAFLMVLKQLQHLSWKRSMMLGVVVGLAVLTKWLMAGSVYIAWGAVILFTDWKNLKSWGQLFMSGMVSLLIFLPWQFYIHTHFPEAAQYELGMMRAHVTDVIEGHEGPWWFYFRNILNQYRTGDMIYALIPIGLILGLRKTHLRNRILVAVFLAVIFGVYSYAATKMESFTWIAAGVIIPVYIEGWLGLVPGDSIRSKVFIALLGLVLIGGLSDPRQLERFTHHEEIFAFDNGPTTRLVQRIEEESWDKRTVLVGWHFNWKSCQAMFFSGITVYDFYPTPEEIRKIEESGRPVKVNYLPEIPEALAQMEGVEVVNFLPE